HKFPDHHPLLSSEYYTEAVKKVETSKIYIFSDDINWCKTNLKFNYMVMPQLQPVPIKTKGKGFFKAIIMWLLSTRNWELINADLAEFKSDDKFDAVLLDLLNPWDYLSKVEEVLAPGRFLVCYVATTTQMSRVVETMKARECWFNPIASEDLHREWHLQGLAVRPNHKMIGHTGFLIQARLMAPGVKAPVKKMKPAKGAYGPDWQAVGENP
ncbi:MAG: hypothetical protein ACO3IA_03205, partial [Candidatus Nanopelagicales bacterium]